MSQTLLKKIISEPLVHFLVIASLFFVIYDYLNPQSFDETKIITVSSNRIEQLKKGFEKTWTRAPTELELKKIIESYALDEIYAREANTLGLGENDEVIRRRLRQKMEFILQDMSVLQQPSEQELSDFYQNNIAAYRDDNQYSFEQVYIMTNRTETSLALVLTEQKQRIKDGRKPQGDISTLPRQMSKASSHQINRQFGFNFNLFLDQAPLNKWTKPIKSGLGLHFIKLSQRSVGAVSALAEIKEAVIKDWRYQQSKVFIESYQKNLLKQYQINIDRNDKLTVAD